MDRAIASNEIAVLLSGASIGLCSLLPGLFLLKVLLVNAVLLAVAVLIRPSTVQELLDFTSQHFKETAEWALIRKMQQDLAEHKSPYTCFHTLFLNRHLIESHQGLLAVYCFKLVCLRQMTKSIG